MALYHISAPVSLTTTSDTTIVPATPGRRIVVTRIWGKLGSTAGNLTIKSGSTALTGPIPLAASDGLDIDGSQGSDDGHHSVLLATASGEALVMQLSAGSFGGAILYRHEE